MLEHQRCQNCQTNFVISKDDFLFYEKMQVPPPTFCPQCRLQRRLAFMNVTRLYKRPCDLCKKDMVSIYRPDVSYTVYCPSCWWSDGWDPYAYGREVDFSRPFLSQFHEVWRSAPMLGLAVDSTTLVNTTYANLAGHLKDCYLIYHTDFDENCVNGFHHAHNKDLLDSSLCTRSELCYDSMHINKTHGGIALDHATECMESAFLRDCTNCQNSFLSANLRNKQYYILNKPFTKEAYREEMRKWDLGSFAVYQRARSAADTHFKRFPRKPRWDEFSTNISGNYVFQSRNCMQCFEILGAENCAHMMLIYNPPIKDSYDVTSWGHNMSRCYECSNVGENVDRVLFSQESGLSLRDAEYNKTAYGGNNLFGCVSVRKGEYCILNKRYTKAAYEDLVPRIKKHMDAMPYGDAAGRTYRYGEFFPMEFSPFAYNESFAQDFFPLSKEEALQQHLSWREPDQRQYAITRSAADLPDHINEAPDGVVNDVIGCTACGRGYRIVAQELALARRIRVPLPRTCPFCRIQSQIDRWVDNLRMATGTCTRCGISEEASAVAVAHQGFLCKKCYAAEVA